MKSFTVSCPTRADLAGGTLDIWPIYSLIEGGKTINVALDLLTRASFEVTAAKSFACEIQSTSKKISIQKKTALSEVKKFQTELRFPAAVVSQYIQVLEALPPLSIRVTVSSQAPVGSGLGASSALGIAIAKGLSQIVGDKKTDWQLLHWIKDAEAAFLETVTGMQDSLAAVFGNLSCFEFQLGDVKRRTYPKEVFEALSERLLILFSGESHHSGLSNWQVYERALVHDKKVLKGFRAIKQITDSVDGELCTQAPDWKTIGKYLNEEWSVRKNLFQVHTQRLDEIIQFLSSQKILGAKVCGAAGGGSLMVLVEPDQKKIISTECRKKGIEVLSAVPFPRGLELSQAPDNQILPRQ